METYKSSMLTLEIEEDDASVNIKWLGKSVDREPGVFIIPIMTKVLDRSSDKKKVIMDFCALEFMNSSTFTPVSKILEYAKAGNTQLQILYKQSVNWQELSFSALRIFETRDKRIEITGR